MRLCLQRAKRAKTFPPPRRRQRAALSSPFFLLCRSRSHRSRRHVLLLLLCTHPFLMLLLNVVMKMLRFTTPPPKRIILSSKERKRRKLARSCGRGVNGGTNCHRVYSFDESRNVFEECWFNGYNGYLFPSDFNLSFPPLRKIVCILN